MPEVLMNNDDTVYDLDGHPVGGYPEERAADAAPVADVSADGADLPKRARRNQDGTITLPLRFPVSVKIRDAAGKVSEERYDTLTFNYLTGGDVRAIQAAKSDMTNIVAFARATKTPQAVMNILFDKMHIADINDGAKCMAFFIESGE